MTTISVQKHQSKTNPSRDVLRALEQQMLDKTLPFKVVHQRLQQNLRALPMSRLQRMPRITPEALEHVRIFHDNNEGVAVSDIDIEPQTPSTLPAEISTELRASGVQKVEWAQVHDLPGAQHQGIARLGESIFRHFGLRRGATPKIVACLDNGDLINSHLELNAVLGFLEAVAVTVSPDNMTMSFEGVIDHYAPEVRLYHTDNYAYLAVFEKEAIHGRYIYAFERDVEARIRQEGDPD